LEKKLKKVEALPAADAALLSDGEPVETSLELFSEETGGS
jgi:hypothetical protein